MAKKRPKVNLTQAIQPRKGDMEKLFATEGDVEQAAGLQLLSIRLDAIVADPDQPRRTFPDESLAELSESIRQDGVIQPIEVTEQDSGQYMIVHGERRWRAAEMAGMETIPAVVRRQDYDTITRLVRQLVENMQREDLNDIDRAAGLLRMRELMQAELDARPADQEDKNANTPWSKTVTWAKVGKRLGMTRQRIHQLIRLLDLPKSIKEDVRNGKLSERDTRVYQGLQSRQQHDLHRARYSQNLSATEVRQVSQHLKQEPNKTVSQAIREIRNPLPERDSEQSFETSFGETTGDPARRDSQDASLKPLRDRPWQEGTVLPPRQTRPNNIDRLDWVRGHLARLQRQGLSPAERRETLRLLSLIQSDVASLLAALEADEEMES
ncbi:MAG: ParB/RepB/Spo0J family partition protein [Chloroflexota bacterium]|jgi:ParB family chromosome partitioning protein